MLLSRKVVTRSGRGFRGHFPSKKLNRLVQFESILERDAIALFEKSEDVVSYREQPELVYYYDESEQRKYYPDFELVMKTGEVVHVEIKPLLHLHRLIAKYKAIQAYYRGRSEYFVVLTDKEIRNENFDLKNLHKIYRKKFLSQGLGDSHDAILL